jgi:hypothetical protein
MAKLGMLGMTGMRAWSLGRGVLGAKRGIGTYFG